MYQRLQVLELLMLAPRPLPLDFLDSIMNCIRGREFAQPKCGKSDLMSCCIQLLAVQFEITLLTRNTGT